jgi:hypothetical protein
MGRDALLGRAQPSRPGRLARLGCGPALQRPGLSDLGTDRSGSQPARSARPANDTWIAATCLSRGLPLATHNAKDFQDFADRDGLVLL